MYILGSSRSGSTMLDLMLGSHPDCFSMGELCLLKKRVCGYCGKDCNYWNGYRQALKVPYYYKTAFEVFKKPILIDSSKKWKWFIERRRKEKFNFSIIHLVRHGLDRLKAKKKQDGHIRPSVIMAWVNTHNRCEEIRKKHNGILIKYEELNGDGLEKVCNHIGIDYRPEMKEFWKRRHHGLLGSKTAYSLVKAYHKKALGEHGEFVKAHGFNVKPRLGHGFLDSRDLKVFKKHFGERLNRRLGYK